MGMEKQAMPWIGASMKATYRVRADEGGTSLGNPRGYARLIRLVPRHIQHGLWKLCSLSLACLLYVPSWTYAVDPMISASSSASLFLNRDGTVWGVGQITNYNQGVTSPVKLLQLPNVIAVTSILGTDVALLADGTLWGSGNNFAGQLADGTTQYRVAPQQIPGLSRGKAISASFWSHILVLRDDGTVWAWGKNDQGQLGDGTKKDRFTPAQVRGLSDIVRVSASNQGSLALKADGTVWVWGANCCGEAGDGKQALNTGDAEAYRLIPTQVHDLDQVVAVSAGDNHHLALRADGTVWSWGLGKLGENGTGQLTNQLLPIQVPGLSHVVALDAKGQNFSVALKDDGTVWAWGSNSMGRLGVSEITSSTNPVQVPALSEIVAISSGLSHLLAMRRDGTVLAWGWNNNGQLGDGTLKDRSRPVALVGPGGSGQLNLLKPAPAEYNHLPSGSIKLDVSSGLAPLSVQAIVADAVDTDGKIKGYFWQSSDGQQATGSSAKFVFPKAGTYQISLLIEDNDGGHGHATQMVVVVPESKRISVAPKVGVGGQNNIALTNDGRILTWGANFGLGFYDEQSLWNLPRANSLPIANGVIGIVDFAINDYHTHVLHEDGTVSSWGTNNSGEAGVGSQVSSINQPQVIPNLPPVQALAAGLYHSLALTKDGRVFAWGSNAYGQLGVGDINIRFQPVEVPGISNVVAITCGYDFSAALKADGTVWAWGNNYYYQLGDGSQISRNRPIQVPGLSDINKIFTNKSSIFAQKADGKVWVTSWLNPAIPGDSGPEFGPRHVSAYDGIVQLSGEWNHILALKGDGTVWSGGLQSSLALAFPGGGDVVGLKQLPGISDAIWIAGNSSAPMILRRDGTVLSWGINDTGQLGNGTLALQQTPGLVINETADGPLDLIPDVANVISSEKNSPFLMKVAATSVNTNVLVKYDPQSLSKNGNVYVVGFVKANSPLLRNPTGFSAAAPDSVVPVMLTRSGFKQMSAGASVEPVYRGPLDTSNNTFTMYDSVNFDNTKDYGVFCVGYATDVGTPSAKGQIRAAVTGKIDGAYQCPPIQVAGTSSFTATSNDRTESLTLNVAIAPKSADIGKPMNVYTWAVAPNGTFFVKKPGGWDVMNALQLDTNFTVTLSNNLAVPIVDNLDLRSLAGTQAYVGYGVSEKDMLDNARYGLVYTIK